MLSKRLTKGLSWLTDNVPRKAKHYWGRAKEKANEDELFGVGLWATVAYFLGPVLLLIVFAKWPSGLNEWGDFLAGAFGPVAFLWLVIGYLQQGKELSNSSDALKRQAEELNLAVAQHKQLADISLQMFQHQVTAFGLNELPRLYLETIELSLELCGLSTEKELQYDYCLQGCLANKGKDIQSVRVRIDCKPSHTYDRETTWSTFLENERKNFAFPSLNIPLSMFDSVLLCIQFKTFSGLNGYALYKLYFAGNDEDGYIAFDPTPISAGQLSTTEAELLDKIHFGHSLD